MSEKRLASSGDSFVDLTEMQIVDLLNELSDENTRLHKKVDKQQSTIKKQDIEIKNLNLHIRKLVDESEISQQLIKEYERNDKLEAKIESMVEQHKARLDKLIEKIGEQQITIKDLERKLQICSAHLLSDECCLTDGQIRKIIKEMTNE